MLMYWLRRLRTRIVRPDIYAAVWGTPMLGNPYWRDVVETCGGLEPLSCVPPHQRLTLIHRYAHTISDPRTIGFLIEHANVGEGRVVEIGAGTGYWAAMFDQAGIRVNAFDQAPPDRFPNQYHHPATQPEHAPIGLFHPVAQGGPEQAAFFPDHVLFMAWPPPDPFALDVLNHYQGNRFIYMGSWRPEQNGSYEFFAALEHYWELIALHQPIRWCGSDDHIAVLRRTIR
jgi:hypothetical protein